MTDEQQDTTEQPDVILAAGPSGVSEPTTERRTYANNVEAFDDKQRASLEAQTAPNPTTDADLAREAYGDDWNRRRGHKLISGTEGDPDALYDHGGSAVDRVGHVLGHTADVEDAAARKASLGTDGEVGRYPVTAEAQGDELRKANESGAESKTLDGGLGTAVDSRAQAEHDEQVTKQDS